MSIPTDHLYDIFGRSEASHPDSYRYSFHIAGVRYEVESPIKLRLHPEDRQFLDASPAALSCSWKVRITLCDTLPSMDGLTLHYTDSTLQIGTDPNGRSIRFYRSHTAKDRPVYAYSVKGDHTIDILFLKSTAYYEHRMFHIWDLLYLEETLLESHTLILHACYLEYRGEAILLTAPSGTGKTTHAKLWEEYTKQEAFPTPAMIRNGDKVCIRCIDGKWYACGYPFHGSADECDNITLPIRAIIVLQQAPDDQILPILPAQKYRILMEQCTISHYEESYAVQSLSLIESLILSGPEMSMLACTKEKSAYDTLYTHLYGTVAGRNHTD